MRDDKEIFASDDDLLVHVNKMVEDAESYLDEQSDLRRRSLDYYQGQMRDLIAEDDLSSFVSQDARATVKKVMPSIMRAILSNGRVVECQPVGPGDEDAAQAASDYLNFVVIPESDGERAIESAILDALIVRTGILKWTAREAMDVREMSYSDQPDDALLGLQEMEGVEIMDLESMPEDDPDALALNPQAMRHSFKLRRTEKRMDVCLEAVRRERFIIHPGSDNIEDAPLVGEMMDVTRSDLVEMGYDRDLVDRVTRSSRRAWNDADDYYRNDNDYSYREDIEEASHSQEMVTVHDVYVRLDSDNDGIAELWRVVYAQGKGGEDGSSDGEAHVLLRKEQVSEAPYAAIRVERDAHQFEGHGIVEDLIDLQRVKTVLSRAMLDSLYWATSPTCAVDMSAVEDPETVMRPRFGRPIELKPGKIVQQALQWLDIPFVGDKAHAMLPYFDHVIEERTGISDSSGGLDPEAFQQMTATSAQIMQEKGAAQAEMLIRTLARDGLKKAMKGLLRLVIAHHDTERMKMVRGEWMSFNPATWNASMDIEINIGLGAGTRERDIQAVQMIMAMQRELMTARAPLTDWEKVYNAIEKSLELMGLQSADMYFTKPTPEMIQQFEQQMGAAGQAEQQAAQAKIELEREKAQAQVAIEEAQKRADLAVREAEARMKREIEELKAEVALVMHRDKMALEAAKLGAMPPPVAAAAAEAEEVIDGVETEDAPLAGVDMDPAPPPMAPAPAGMAPPPGPGTA